MNSSLSKLDRDVARSFLNAPSDLISYLPIPMKSEHSRMAMMPFPSSSNSKEMASLDFPTNPNISPMYYDVIIDTVTDYDSE
jgi:hypothetical protein